MRNLGVPDTPPPVVASLPSSGSAPAPGPDALPAIVAQAAQDPRNEIGPYVACGELGHGGAGAVYRAWHRPTARWVALKFLRDVEPAQMERLAREARMIGRLSHPHIVPLYDVGEHGGRPFLTMKLIEGRTLHGMQLGARRAAALMRDAADAVHNAHANGIIHRDLKPANLMLDGAGHVWVMDFGLARSREGGSTLTIPGIVLGTPEYMAPEQARSARADERSDVYGLGATLYELLTGRAPFEGETALEIMTRLLRDDPRPPRQIRPQIDPELEGIVLKALEKDPSRRYPSARAFAEDLRRYLAGEVVEARPAGRLTIVVKWTRRHRLATAMLAVVLASAVVLATGATLYAVNIEKARVAAETKLAESLVSEANALGAVGRWREARKRYTEAGQLFSRLGVEHAGPELGLLDAENHNPSPLWKHTAHKGTVRGVALLERNRLVVSVDDAGTLRVWDLRTGVERRHHGWNDVALMGIAVAPDERSVAVACGDGRVRVWDPFTGRDVLTVHAHGARRVRDVAYSPDGRWLVSGGEGGTLALIDLPSGRIVDSVQAEAEDIRAVAFAPDGRSVASGGSSMLVKTFAVPDLRPLAQLAGHHVFLMDLAYAPDGRELASASYDRTVRLWDLATGTSRVLQGHANAVSTVAFPADGRRIITSSLDGTIRVWDRATGMLGEKRDAHESYAYAVVSSADGRFAVSGSRDGEVALWSLGLGGAGERLVPLAGSNVGVSLSPDARVVFTQGPVDVLRAWDPATGKLLREGRFDVPWPSRLVFSSFGERAALMSNARGLELIDLFRGTVRSLDRDVGTVDVLHFSQDTHWLYAGVADGSVRVYDVPGNRLARSLMTGVKHVRTLTLSRDERRLLVGGDGVELRDLATNAVLLRFAAEGFAVLSVALSADERLVAAGSNERVARVWDLASGRLLATLRGHAGEVGGVTFSMGDHALITRSSDRTVRVWDLASEREMHTFYAEGPADLAGATDATADALVISHADGLLGLLDVHAPTRIADTGARAAKARDRLAREPGHADSLRALGEWYALRNVDDWAVELLEQAAARGADVSPLTLARARWQAGDRAGARQAYLAARERNEVPAAYLDACLRALEREPATSTVTAHAGPAVAP